MKDLQRKWEVFCLLSLYHFVIKYIVQYDCHGDILMMNSAKIINYHHLVHHLYYNAKIPDKNILKGKVR